MTGYSFSIDHVEYDAFKNGQPFTLLDCWREVYGVGHAVIYAPSGRVVLRNAGAISARWQHIHRSRRIRGREQWFRHKKTAAALQEAA